MVSGSLQSSVRLSDGAAVLATPNPPPHGQPQWAVARRQNWAPSVRMVCWSIHVILSASFSIFQRKIENLRQILYIRIRCHQQRPMLDELRRSKCQHLLRINRCPIVTSTARKQTWPHHRCMKKHQNHWWLYLPAQTFFKIGQCTCKAKCGSKSSEGINTPGFSVW